MKVFVVVHPNKPKDPEITPSDYDGTMLEMAKAILQKKNNKGTVHLYEHVKSVVTLSKILPSKLDTVILAGHSQAHVFTDETLEYIPLRERKIAGEDLKHIIIFLFDTLHRGVSKITFYCCQVGDNINHRNCTIGSHSNRHKVQHVDVGWLYDLQARFMDDEGHVSTLEFIVLHIIYQIGQGRFSKKQICVKAPIGFGFFHGTSTTSGICKFRSFPAEYYPLALKLLKDTTNRSDNKWEEFEHLHVENNTNPWSITFVIDSRLFHPSKVDYNLLESFRELLVIN